MRQTGRDDDVFDWGRHRETGIAAAWLRLDGHRFWLLASIIGVIVVFLAYWGSHVRPEVPALYFDMAGHIQEAGYGLPERIPGYTSEGVPFGYPPLGFYLLALVQAATGASWMTVGMVFAFLFNIGAVVAFYAFVYRLFDDVPVAGIAAVVFAVSPAVFRWHVIASGSVRALGYALVIVGAYTAVRIFRDGEYRWAVAAAAAWTATAFTHPECAVYFVVTFLVAYLAFDRSGTGFAVGAAVGIAGLVLTAPWWVTVALRHGPEVFFAAAGTHGGVANYVDGYMLLPTLFQYGFNVFGFEELRTLTLSIWMLPVFGVIYLLVRGRPFVPLWFAATLFVFGVRVRFSYPALVVASVAVLWYLLLPALRDSAGDDRIRRAVVPAVTVTLLLGATLSGIAFASNQYHVVGFSATMPEHDYGEHDAAAMAWVRENTAADSTFVVVGPEEEFPLYADRTSLVVPWGSEWRGRAVYQHQRQVYSQLLECPTATCVAELVDWYGIEMDYLYVSKSIAEATTPDGYEVVYENDGVLVIEPVATNE